VFLDNSIGVCILRESRCELVVEATKNSSARFRDLVLYPERGQMFWVRKEDDDRILQMASMNGEKVGISGLIKVSKSQIYFYLKIGFD
jgi:hypothetical protein